MFYFSEGLYTDIRIEDIFETDISFTLDNLDEIRERRYKAAFIRIFDGEIWYYSALSDIGLIQNEIEKLVRSATPDKNINNHPIIKKLQINKGEFLKFKKDNISLIDKKNKLNLLKSYFPVIKKEPLAKMWTAIYKDVKKVKNFYSSIGSDLKFDFQKVGLSFGMNFANKEDKFDESFIKVSDNFSDLKSLEKEFENYIEKSKDVLLNSKPIKPGKYTVILSPRVAGNFAHESFGHKSEADFMIEDETMKKEWEFGKKIGSDILSIVDDGEVSGSGFVPFDDEGTKGKKVYLIKNGILKGRLHSTTTASVLNEEVTGNARAVCFEDEPIVRMRTTYILPGNQSKEDLFADVKEGIFVDTMKFGTGMSTFTIAPSIAYFIKNGKIDYPVNISVITGNVFETLSMVDALSDKLEIYSSIGGCGKMDQFPLNVASGGPYMKVKEMMIS